MFSLLPRYIIQCTGRGVNSIVLLVPAHGGSYHLGLFVCNRREKSTATCFVTRTHAREFSQRGLESLWMSPLQWVFEENLH